MIRGVSPINVAEAIVSHVLYLAMRRVLHLPMVTQCTILDDFGLFLVLADKVCRYICYITSSS